MLGNLSQNVDLTTSKLLCSSVEVLTGEQPGHPVKQSEDIYHQEWMRPRQITPWDKMEHHAQGNFAWALCFQLNTFVHQLPVQFLLHEAACMPKPRCTFNQSGATETKKEPVLIWSSTASDPQPIQQRTKMHDYPLMSFWFQTRVHIYRDTKHYQIGWKKIYIQKAEKIYIQKATRSCFDPFGSHVHSPFERTLNRTIQKPIHTLHIYTYINTWLQGRRYTDTCKYVSISKW